MSAKRLIYELFAHARSAKLPPNITNLTHTALKDINKRHFLHNQDGGAVRPWDATYSSIQLTDTSIRSTLDISFPIWHIQPSHLTLLRITSPCCFLLGGHRCLCLKSPTSPRAWRRRRLRALRKQNPCITGAEAKVYATLKSDTIRVIVQVMDSDVAEGERAICVEENFLNLNGKNRHF